MAHFQLELPDPLLGRAQFNGKLMRQVHGPVAIRIRRLGRLLQQGNDRLARTLDGVAVAAQVLGFGRKWYRVLGFWSKRDAFLSSLGEWNDLLDGFGRTFVH